MTYSPTGLICQDNGQLDLIKKDPRILMLAVSEHVAVIECEQAVQPI